MPPIAQPAQGPEPVKVEIVRAADPRKDVGWWITTIGPVLITALALVVAILSVLEQHGADQATQTAAARTYASQVSFFPDPSGSGVFEIENSAQAAINSVLLQSAPHERLDSLGTLPPCRTFSVHLSSPTGPVIYFRDANGMGWELPLGGDAQPSVDPSAILAVLPFNADHVSILSGTELNPQPVPGCS